MPWEWTDLDPAADARAQLAALDRQARRAARPAAGHAAPAEAGANPATARCEGKAGRTVAAPPEQVWAMLLDAERAGLHASPAAHGVQKLADPHFQADVTLGVGPVQGPLQGRCRTLRSRPAARRCTLAGSVTGALGNGGGNGRVTLDAGRNGRHDASSYVYDAAVGGKVAAIGGRLLDGAARVHHRPVLRPRWPQGRRAVRQGGTSLPLLTPAAGTSGGCGHEARPVRLSCAPRRRRRGARRPSPQHGADARMIAGGQSLMPMLNMRLAKPA